MKFYKNHNGTSYIKWNVESGSGFFSIAQQDDTPSLAGKFIQINYFSGSFESNNPIGMSMIQWETKGIKNPGLIEITEAEYDAFLSTACTNVQNNWSTV